MIPKKDVENYEALIQELTKKVTSLQEYSLVLEKENKQLCAENANLGEALRNAEKRMGLCPNTGIYNRPKFSEELKKYLKKERPVYGMMVYIDFNNFKIINDLYGHDVGDELLVSFARALGITLRSTDIWGRAGGDEFVVFLSDVKETCDAEKAMEKICLCVKGGIFTHAVNSPYADKVADLFSFDRGYYLVTKREAPEEIINKAEKNVPKLVERRRRTDK